MVASEIMKQMEITIFRIRIFITDIIEKSVSVIKGSSYIIF